MEFPRRQFLSALLSVALVAVAVGWWLRRSADVPEAPRIPGEGSHIIVEVLNATRVDGLARAMTRRLRRAGIDVVYFGSAKDQDRDTTLILVRRGDTTVAAPIRQVLGAGRAVVALDPELLLDASVLLGRDVVTPRHVDP